MQRRVLACVRSGSNARAARTWPPLQFLQAIPRPAARPILSPGGGDVMIAASECRIGESPLTRILSVSAKNHYGALWREAARAGRRRLAHGGKNGGQD